MDEGSSEQEAPCHLMELDLLKHKLRRLVAKLQKHDVHIEVFDHEDIQYGDIIGRGGEGVVRKCTINYQGIVNLQAAAKTLSDNSPDAICLTLEEIELLCLAQDHIFATTVKVYGMAAVPDEDNPEYAQLVILTEAGIMNALQLYQDTNVPLHVTLDMWSRLAAAMHLIHNKHIIHQDLKPENILITDIRENNNHVIERLDFRIIDMGMARRLFTEKIVTDDILGTNGYHPPEVLFEDGYDFRADIFMLGITFAVMLHSPTFLRSKSLSGLLKNLHDAKLDEKSGKKLYEEIIEPSIEQTVPNNVKNMIWKMMESQERRHITLGDISQMCSREAETMAKRYQQQDEEEPPVLQPSRCANCSDSGFGANSSSSQLDTSVPQQQASHSARAGRPARRRRLRTKRRDDDVSPTVSISSTRTCMTELSTSSSAENRRQTRAMKRHRSEDNLGGELLPAVAKRTRLGTIRELHNKVTDWNNMEEY